MNLRPYQSDLLDRTYSALQTHRRVLMQLPTGGGKTVMFVSTIKDYYKEGKRTLLLVHRKELITQACSKIFAQNVPYGLIAAGFTPSPSQQVQIASVQTAIRRKLPYHFDLIIIDEAHHATAESYRTIVNQYPNAKILGVTATPCRTNGMGFENDFDYLVHGPQVTDLIKEGYLVAPKLLASPLREDLTRIKMTAGDYNEAALAALLDQQHLVGGLVEQYKRKAAGMRTVVFAVNVQHSKHIVDQYKAEGIAACHVDGETPQIERDRILRDFSQGKFLVLSNVGIVTEGFDVPAIECVQLARPTKSLSLYLQMVGRGLRPSDGKGHAVVLDHANCVFDHGKPDAPRQWTLQGVQKRKSTKTLMCRDEHGAIYAPRELPAHIEDIDLVEVDTDPSRTAFLEKMVRTALEKNYKPLWAWYQFIKKYATPSEYEIALAQRLMKLKPGWIQYQRVQHGFREPWDGYTGPLPHKPQLQGVEG